KEAQRTSKVVQKGTIGSLGGSAAGFAAISGPRELVGVLRVVADSADAFSAPATDVVRSTNGAFGPRFGTRELGTMARRTGVQSETAGRSKTPARVANQTRCLVPADARRSSVVAASAMTRSAVALSSHAIRAGCASAIMRLLIVISRSSGRGESDRGAGRSRRRSARRPKCGATRSSPVHVNRRRTCSRRAAKRLPEHARHFSTADTHNEDHHRGG